MKTRISLFVCRRNLNEFIACLLSFSLFMVPFIPMASAMSRSESHGSSLRRNKSSQSQIAKVNPGVNAPVAAPAPAPFDPVISATKVDAILSDDGDGKADPGTTEKIEYTVTISNTGTTDATNVQFTDTIDPHTTLVGGSITTQPIAVNDSYSALGNVRITVPDGASDLLGNDCDPNPAGGPCTNAGLTITTLAGDNTAPFAGTSAQGGQVTATLGDGNFQYNPAPGFEGSDSFTYTVTDATGKTDTATVSITVSGMIWFVNAAAGSGGDGRLTTPFNCLVGAGCFSPVAADDPGDNIFMFSGTYNDNAALVLLNNQKLIGAAATAPLATIAGVTVPTFSDALPGTGGASPVITSTASGIQLASGNLLRGFTVGNTSPSAGNYDITNTTTATVGTLNISEVILNGTGGLFRADGGGTLNVAFASATTTSAGTHGFHLVNTTGSVAVGSGGAISGVGGSDVLINGGTVAFSLGSTITHAANSSTVDITGHTTGGVIFSGTINSTSGTGLQFSNADSTYNFNGVVTLNGGDAGVDILGGSGGTFTFVSGSAITSPSGTAFNVGGASSPSVTYSGSITQNTSGQRVVNIDGTTSNTITFNTGTITGGAVSTGININNANGNVTFSNGMTMGTSGARMTNQAITIAGGTGTYGLGVISVFTNNAQGLVATNADGTINATGVVDATNTGAAANLAAIRIDGPGGLTTLGLSFTNVSASATAFGIQLVDTNGNFTVTGSATGTDRCGGLVTVNAVGTPASFTAPVIAECNGGTIQNITTSGVQATNATNISLSRINFSNANTADGGVAGGTCDLGVVSTCNGAIDLSNVSGVTLSRININGAEEQGIVGSSVTGFSLTNSNVQNAGDEAAENGAYFINLFGTVTVTGSRFTGSSFNNFGVLNDTAGTPLNMTVTGSIFSSNSAIGGDGLVVDTRIGTNTNMRVTTSTFTANKDDHFNFVSSSNAVANVTFDDNTLTGGHASPTGQGIAIRVGGPFSGTLRFDIEGNSVNGAIPTAINTGLGSSEPAGTMHGFIRNNIVGTSGVNNSGSAQGSCILAEANGLGSGGVHAAPAGTFTVSVTGNTLRQCFDKGIDLLAVRDGDNNMNATVSGNNVNELDDAASRQAIRLETGSSLLDETGTVCADILNNTLNAAITEEMSVRARSIATLRFPGYTGGTGDTTALQNYLQARNPAGGTAVASVLAPATFNNTVPAGSACAQPTTPTLPSLPLTSSVNPTTFTDSVKSPEPHRTVAIKTGLESTMKFDQVRSVTTVPTAKTVAQKSQAVSEVRTSGEKAKTRSHHARLTPRALAAPMMAGETIGPIVIGTLRPGDSVVITFQVTVNNPPNLTGVPPAVPQVENQGSISYAESVTAVLTDDPAIGGGPNKTATPVDLFDTSTALVSNLNPSNFGDMVTFTATVTETPVQASADPAGTVDFIDTSNANAVVCNDVPLTGGTAQCQTSTLTAGTHNIRADYSGDGNFDPSQSNIVAQVVNACTPNPIVTTTADAGAGSLREAIANVCTGTTITFNIAGAGPHTITLTTGELQVAKNVTINNNSGESITVSGGGTSRVFNINTGFTAAIIGLTISGGSASNGAGVLNNGTLTIVNSTLTGNTATSDGGGVGNSASATALTLINTTVSGNNANGFGGGVDVLGGTATIINSTITNNHGNNDDTAGGGAGGLRNQGGTVTLHNTIVAGNFAGSGTGTRNDIEGALQATSSNNLIGDGSNMTGITNGVNGNQVGTSGSPIDPLLGSLANNGGTTQTHALLATSPAVEAGSNAALPVDTFDLDGDANVAETLPVDQRGTGFPRNADSQDANTTQTVDIGAFELHPSIENIPNQTTAEDTPKLVTFNLGDDTGALIASVTATSSNTALVTSDGAHLSFTGSGGSRTLTITPNTNANSLADGGTTTITVTVTATNGRTAVDTFDLTVTEVNDPPVAVDDVLTAVNEDSGTRIIPFTDLTGNDSAGPANESTQTLTVTNVSNPVGGTVIINGTNVEFTLTAGFSGTASFDYTVTDNGTTNGAPDPKSDTGSVSFAVNGVNDPPSFTKGPDQTVNEDAGPQTVPNWATDISAGPGETQVLTFNVSVTGTTGNLAFSSAPAINATTGTLTYTTAADTNGTANISVTLSDDGSNTPPNSNTSAAQTFTITVNAVNDAPTFQLGANPSVAEDAGPQTIPGFAFNFQPGPVTATDEAGQTLVGYTLTATGTTGGLTFSAAPALSNAGTLTFTADSNSSGTATFDAVATDSGSGTPPNVNQSAPISFTITVNGANDGPVNTVPGPQSTNQNTPLTFSSGNGNQISVADPDAGANTIQVTLTATNGTLTLSGTSGLSFSFTDANGTGAGDGTADATMTFRGTIANINTALNGMTFTPNLGFSGAASLTITTNDLGNTGTGGPLTDTDTVNIQVSNNISIQDAQVAEPPSGSVNMIFTVTLSAPAPAGGVSVNFTTQAQLPAITHATAGQDYTTTSGTVNFAVGEQVKTINVPVLADNANAEVNETFLVVLSSPVNGTIADGTATGTILAANQPGTIVISELRTSGPGGAGDDFVEVYNNTNSPHTVNGTNGGYGLFKMGATCSDTPVLIGVIPNGTVIPARGHYLFVGSAYSLGNYGGTGAAAGDSTMSSDIESDRNVAIFATGSVTTISSANRLDSVGFGSNTGGVCDLFREGATLTPLSGSVLEYSYFRDECGKSGNPAQFGPCPTNGFIADTGVNDNDFIFVDTAGEPTAAGQLLGAPGPQNLGSARLNLNVAALLLDSTIGNPAPPNRVRDTTTVTNGANGTLSVRRRFVNNTGAPVTRLKFRIVDFTSLGTSGIADLRVLSSGTEVVTGIQDSATCQASNGSPTTPCTVTVLGTTLETPPNQLEGGSLNSTLSAGTITLGTPLAPGASINLRLLLGVQHPGSFKFFFNVEALP